MAATAAMAARLRKMVDEPTEATYDDDLIDDYIESYALLDVLGTDPYEIDFTTEPPSLSERDEWIPTYDLNAAARDIWEEKAAAVAENFDFSADGGKYSRSQKYDQYMKKARFHGSRRSMKTIKLYPSPRIIVTEETT
jgi:hypothetical protein